MEQNTIINDFRATIDHQLQYVQLCPITFSADLVYAAVLSNEDVICQDNTVQVYQEMIDVVNVKTVDLLIFVCQYYEKALRIPWKMEHQTLDVMNNPIIISCISNLCKNGQEKDYLTLKARFQQYEERILEYSSFITYGLHEAIESAVLELVQEQFESTRLMKGLTLIIQKQMERIFYELFDFIYVKEQDELFSVVKQSLYNVLLNFYHFIYKMSYFANKEMDTLNEIMEKNTCLANIDTYKIMQIEISKRIVQHVSELIETCWFYRPEFYKHKDSLVFHSLKHFYHFAEQVHSFMHLPKHPESLAAMLQNQKIQVKETPQNIQVISTLGSILQAQVLLDPNSYPMFNHLENKNLIYQDLTKQKLGLDLFEQAANLIVIQAQDVKNIKTNKGGLLIKFKSPMDEYGVFLVILIRGSIVVRELSSVDVSLWGPISSIQQYEMMSLQQFLFIQSTQLGLFEANRDIKSAMSLEKDNTDGLAFLANENIKKEELKSVLTLSEESYLSNPGIHHKHIQMPKRPLKFGASQEVVAGKTIGTGLGYLIVNCMDEDMPWEDKLKDAGFTTLTWGTIFVLSTRLPLVGMLIQQALLVYAVTVTLNNKVVNKEQKAKSLGHIAVQISIGVVCVMGAHVLIPAHFLGALIGGICAGVCIGLYTKFVVPKTMISLFSILDHLEKRITPKGYICFNPVIIDILEINQKFFTEYKPKDMRQSNWLTLIIVCLANEVHYMYQLILTKHIEKVTKKLEKENSNEELHEELEELKIQWIQNDIRMSEWRESRNYVIKNKLSVLDNHENIQEFIEGMLANFKVP